LFLSNGTFHVVKMQKVFKRPYKLSPIPKFIKIGLAI
jgi:hypothetical protein